MVFAECAEYDLTARRLERTAVCEPAEGNSICIETAFAVLTNNLAIRVLFTFRRTHASVAASL